MSPCRFQEVPKGPGGTKGPRGTKVQGIQKVPNNLMYPKGT